MTRPRLFGADPMKTQIVRMLVLLALPVVACSDDGAASALDGAAADRPADLAGADRPPADLAGADLAGLDLAGPSDQTLSDKYPGDVGIAGDPAVVWAEGFEAGSVAAIAARYDDARTTGFTLVSDVPPKSGGQAAAQLVASPSNNAVDLFKQFPPQDEIYARWYAKYAAGVTWHHSGLWIGGHNPPTGFPDPQAGLRPDGTDRFSVSLEPVYGGAQPRFDFYNYWMTMHSWMSSVTNDGTSYYGNTLVHRNDFTIDEGQWVCLEVHIKLNSDLSSSGGAVLEVWKNDQLMQRFDDAGPLGYWIRDKFCPMAADGQECTDYPAPSDTKLDLRFRSDAALRINTFWPQNYITEGPTGTLLFDDMVLAKTRVGCLR